jgi:predicted DCC family thiol-disulfide oxidoreductase YuxK
MNLVLFDGECGLCSRSVNWLALRDRRRTLRFAPLQGETARELAREVPGFRADLSGMALVSGDPGGRRTVWRGSDAAVRAVMLLGGAWRAAGVLLAVPRCARDTVYGWVAANRRRFGADRCARAAQLVERLLP